MGSLIVACELLVAACMWDLVPRPGIEPGPPALGAWSPNHCTTREVPWVTYFNPGTVLHSVWHTKESKIISRVAHSLLQKRDKNPWSCRRVRQKLWQTFDFFWYPTSRPPLCSWGSAKDCIFVLGRAFLHLLQTTGILSCPQNKDAAVRPCSANLMLLPRISDSNGKRWRYRDYWEMFLRW